MEGAVKLLVVVATTLLALAAACDVQPEDEEQVHPCEAAEHCVHDGDESRCEEGYEWEDPDDRDNFNCVAIAVPEGPSWIGCSVDDDCAEIEDGVCVKPAADDVTGFCRAACTGSCAADDEACVRYSSACLPIAGELSGAISCPVGTSCPASVGATWFGSDIELTSALVVIAPVGGQDYLVTQLTEGGSVARPLVVQLFLPLGGVTVGEKAFGTQAIGFLGVVDGTTLSVLGLAEEGAMTVTQAGRAAGQTFAADLAAKLVVDAEAGSYCSDGDRACDGDDIAECTVYGLAQVVVESCGPELTCESAECVEKPPLTVPEDGAWGGSGIQFTVSGGGTQIDISSADFGTCSNGGCTQTSNSTCGSCASAITQSTSGTTFNNSSMGCSGSFDTPTTASGTCTKVGDCCTSSRSWTAQRL